MWCKMILFTAALVLWSFTAPVWAHTRNRVIVGMDVYDLVRNGDNSMTFYKNGAVASPPSGATLSDPALSRVYAAGRGAWFVIAGVRGTNSNVYCNAYNTSTSVWHGWGWDQQDVVGYAPAIDSDDTNNYWLGVNSAGNIYAKTTQGCTLQGWTALTGATNVDPLDVVYNPGDSTAYFFVRGTNGLLYRRTYARERARAPRHHAPFVGWGARSEYDKLHPTLTAASRLTLFSDPTTWPTARLQMDLFGVYAGDPSEIDAYGGTTNSGKNSFWWLQYWLKKVMLETPAIKGWDCSGSTEITWTKRNIGGQPGYTGVEGYGGKVWGMQMDEPLIAEIIGCSGTFTTAASKVSNYINTIKAYRPGIVIGDIEPMPALSNGTIQSFLSQLIANGTKPDFFLIDWDRNQVTNWARINDMKSFCAANNITFAGPVYWSAATTDPDFYTQTYGFIQDGKTNGALGTYNDFQSWQLQGIPTVVPESQTNTHTKLLTDACSAILGNC